MDLIKDIEQEQIRTISRIHVGDPSGTCQGR
jgi:hypothetical protein